MNKKIKSVLSLVLLIASIFTFLVKPVLAEEETPQLVATDSQEVNIYMFRGDGCTYCAKALTWFEEIEAEEGKYFNLITYEVWNDEENKALMDRVANYMKDDVSGVPYIIVGKKTYTGFDDSYKEEILNYVHDEYTKNVDERFDVMKDINANKDKSGNDIATYIIIIVVVVLFGFVVIARNTADEETALNYEEIIEEEKKEENKKEQVKEKKTTSNKVKKAGSTKSTSASKKTKK